jgi:low temperature requirement protein LtrA
VNISGVLVVTAGIPRAFASMDFSVMLVGYVIMRISLVAQWFRVAREDPFRRKTALRFAWCIGVLQVLWLLQIALLPQPFGFLAFLVLAACELAIPIYAESSGRPTPWNPEHVSERYGLFTLIVMGEVIFASTTAVQAAATGTGLTGPLLLIAAGGLLLVFSLWWMYFKQSAALGAHASLRRGVAWGYGHYVIFASLAALGAGLQTTVDSTTESALLTAFGAAAVVAVPTAAYLLATGVLHGRGRIAILIRASAPSAIVVVLAAAAAPVIGVGAAVLAMGLVTSGTIALHLWAASRAAVPAPGEQRSEPALASTESGH